MAVSFTTVAFTLARAAAATVISGVVLAAAVAPAKAQSSETRSIAVSTAGLNLAQPDGQAVLAHRLSAAAQHVCREIDNLQLDTGCYEAAMANARKTADVLIAAAKNRTVVAAR